MNAFWLALSFLTRIPVPHHLQFRDVEIGKSALYYPLVGMLLGGGWVALFFIFNYLAYSSFVIATLLLGAMIFITGALHWDGLADTADAWLAAGDREKTLSVLKDVHCGAAAVIVTAVVLLIFCAALEQNIYEKNLSILFFTPIMSRLMLLLALLTTPYAREEGLGSVLVKNLPKKAAITILLIGLVAVAVFFKLKGLFFLISSGVVFFVWRIAGIKKIGGMTGDTLGALVIWTELVFAVIAVAIYP